MQMCVIWLAVTPANSICRCVPSPGSNSTPSPSQEPPARGRTLRTASRLSTPGSAADRAVDGLADQVGVPVVPCVVEPVAEHVLLGFVAALRIVVRTLDVRCDPGHCGS